MRQMRQRAHAGSSQLQADALLVLRLPSVFQRKAWHGHGIILCPSASGPSRSTRFSLTSRASGHRDLNIAQSSAWHLGHRIREAIPATILYSPAQWKPMRPISAVRKATSTITKSSRPGAAQWQDRIAGVKDRETNQVDAEVVEKTDGPTLRQFVHHRTERTTLVFTDEAAAYNRLNRPHEATSARCRRVCPWPTPTGWRASGRCSSAATSGFTTG